MDKEYLYQIDDTFPKILRNPITFEGLVIPEIVKPIPNSIPTKIGIAIFFIN
jgi:hypothetical protein